MLKLHPHGKLPADGSPVVDIRPHWSELEDNNYNHNATQTYHVERVADPETAEMADVWVRPHDERTVEILRTELDISPKMLVAVIEEITNDFDRIVIKD